MVNDWVNLVKVKLRKKFPNLALYSKGKNARCNPYVNTTRTTLCTSPVRSSMKGREEEAALVKDNQ